jgi:predicted ATPase/class 3 adenylate cyclase
MTAGPSGRDLPTGTVTFLFTDIEGSTLLLQELGPGYQEVQDRHASIMRAAIADHDGVEMRTEGDSFFAAFPTPGGAVRATIEAQVGLAREEWPHGRPLRVRMGLHTGEGRPGGDDYLGIDVNRAARIAAAGYGGQVLISDATRSLVEHDLPNGVRIRNLGEHRLKDIVHPERLYDLEIAGLRADFPPPKTLDARPNNLPLQLTSFVGRESEIADTVRLLTDHRLVTLTGPGGTGKTRLALAVAAELLPSFADGAFFVDLAPIADPGQVCPAICQVLGVREEPGSELIDTLVSRFAGEDLLLLLDNFEHLLEAASLVDRILRRVLVTSRTPLGLYGEQEHDVPPLEVPDPRRLPEPEATSRYEAVALFVDRARAARPDFEVTRDTAPSVAEICARLDGLPLAIELAASRIKVLSPEALLSRLSHSLDLLTAAASNLPQRQRTLRATIAWSEGLLPEPDRQLFARLSVFAGGAELEAAEAVANPNGDLGIDTLDGLTSLIDKSLVRRIEAAEGELRFRMLETIREYAAERLDEQWDLDPTRRRHAEHFLALAEAAAPRITADVEGLDRLDREHDNLLAAFQWSIESGEIDRAMRAGAAVWRFWQQRGHFEIGRTWMERLLDQPGDRTAARAAAEGAAGSLAYWQADIEGTERHYGEALAIYEELGDAEGVARARYDLAFVPLLKGTGYDLSLELLEDSLKVFEDIGDHEWVAKTRGNIAFFLVMQGEYAAALPLLEEAVERSRERGDLFHLVDDMMGVAQAHRLLGHHEVARAIYLECLDIVEGAGSVSGISSTLLMMSTLYSSMARHERSMRLYGAAENITQEIGGSHPPEALLGDPVGDARKAIGKEATDRALADGRAMTRDEAVAYARSADD